MVFETQIRVGMSKTAAEVLGCPQGIVLSYPSLSEKEDFIGANAFVKRGLIAHSVRNYRGGCIKK